MHQVSTGVPQNRWPSTGWFELVARDRALLASLVVVVFPLVMAFTALAVNILIYGLFALGFWWLRKLSTIETPERFLVRDESAVQFVRPRTPVQQPLQPTQPAQPSQSSQPSHPEEGIRR